MEETVLFQNVNPDLYEKPRRTRQTRSEYVYIDSRDDEIFGENSNPNDFTVQLPKSIQKVKSIAIKQMSIPYVWYNVDETNNEFAVISERTGGNNRYAYVFRIPKGNYTLNTLAQTVDSVLSLIPYDPIDPKICKMSDAFVGACRVANSTPYAINNAVAPFYDNDDNTRMKTEIRCFTAKANRLTFTRYAGSSAVSGENYSSFAITFDNLIAQKVLGRDFNSAYDILGFPDQSHRPLNDVGAKAIASKLDSVRGVKLIPKTTRIFMTLENVPVNNIQNKTKNVFDEIIIKGISDINKMVILPFYEFTTKNVDIPYIEKIRIKFEDPDNKRFSFLNFGVSMILEIVYEI